MCVYTHIHVSHTHTLLYTIMLNLETGTGINHSWLLLPFSPLPISWFFFFPENPP